MSVKMQLEEVLSEYTRDFPETDASFRERVHLVGGGNYALKEVVVDNFEPESGFEMSFVARLHFEGTGGRDVVHINFIMMGHAVLMMPGGKWAVERYHLLNPYRSLLGGDEEDDILPGSFF